ncbi:MAG: restriction endonuclease subunit S [Parvibaculaceae bacterium]|nr:restriction endonuclease subunit S [Parvibaculaceae bacterium]
MEVKLRYKQTEVGLIPEDWEITRLGEASDVLTGFPFPSYEFSSLGVRLLRGSNVKRNAIDWDEAITRNWPAISPDLNKYELREGDIVIAMDGALVGRSFAMVSKEDLPALLVQRVARLRSRKTEQKLIGSWINSDHFIRHVDLVKTHTAIPHISPKDIREFTLAVPSEGTEQRAIATTLSDMDALLDGLDRLIAKKRAIKQATMQQLLTAQTRLPGFSGEWEVKRLGDLADIRSGGTPSTGDAGAWDGTIPWCTPTDITALEGRKYLTTTNRAITEHGLITSSAELIPARSIVMTSRATIGECAINAVPVTTNQGFKNLVPHDSVDVEFLYYLLSTQTQGLIGLSAGSTFLEIGKTQLRQYEVKLPAEKDEQTAIATVLSDMDAEITVLETRRAKTRAFKRAMMQELLTGRTRLVMPYAKPVGEEAAQTEGRKANVHFLRSVLAAEIIDQLHDQPTFGHVKFEKMMFLAEHLCQVDTGSTYHRKAAGPYDNRALRSIDSQLQKQQWFEARKQEGRYQYVPLAKRGGHKPYFERHFSGIGETFEKILSAFKTAKTEQCEIVATLLAAWSDLLREKGIVSDEMIVHEVLHNWHEAKQRIPEDRWLVALGWMREKGFVPKGATLP